MLQGKVAEGQRGTVCARIDCTEIASLARVSFNSKNRASRYSDALFRPFDTQKGERRERERGDLASDSTRDTSVIIYYKVGKMGNYNEEEKKENDNNNYSASCVSFKPRALIMLV